MTDTPISYFIEKQCKVCGFVGSPIDHHNKTDHEGVWTIWREDPHGPFTADPTWYRKCEDGIVRRFCRVCNDGFSGSASDHIRIVHNGKMPGDDSDDEPKGPAAASAKTPTPVPASSLPKKDTTPVAATAAAAIDLTKDKADGDGDNDDDDGCLIKECDDCGAYVYMTAEGPLKDAGEEECKGHGADFSRGALCEDCGQYYCADTDPPCQCECKRCDCYPGMCCHCGCVVYIDRGQEGDCEQNHGSGIVRACEDSVCKKHSGPNTHVCDDCVRQRRKCPSAKASAKKAPKTVAKAAAVSEPKKKRVRTDSDTDTDSDESERVDAKELTELKTKAYESRKRVEEMAAKSLAETMAKHQAKKKARVDAGKASSSSSSSPAAPLPLPLPAKANTTVAVPSTAVTVPKVAPPPEKRKEKRTFPDLEVEKCKTLSALYLERSKKLQWMVSRHSARVKNPDVIVSDSEPDDLEADPCLCEQVMCTKCGKDQHYVACIGAPACKKHDPFFGERAASNCTFCFQSFCMPCATLHVPSCSFTGMLTGKSKTDVQTGQPSS